MRNIPKEAAEDEEEESNSQSLNNSKESSDEDIENLLAPQEPTNKTYVFLLLHFLLHKMHHGIFFSPLLHVFRANTVKSEGNTKGKHKQ